MNLYFLVITKGLSAMLNNDFVSTNKLSVEKTFYDFLETEVLPATSIEPALFWEGFSKDFDLSFNCCSMDVQWIWVGLSMGVGWVFKGF